MVQATVLHFLVFNPPSVVLQDCVWVLCGRHNGISDILQIIEVTKKFKWDAKVIIGNYVISMLRGFYWTKERGFANKSGSEPFVLLWKGKLPPKMPKTRMYTDVGSATH